MASRPNPEDFELGRQLHRFLLAKPNAKSVQKLLTESQIRYIKENFDATHKDKDDELEYNPKWTKEKSLRYSADKFFKAFLHWEEALSAEDEGSDSSEGSGGKGSEDDDHQEGGGKGSDGDKGRGGDDSKAKNSDGSEGKDSDGNKGRGGGDSKGKDSKGKDSKGQDSKGDDKTPLVTPPRSSSPPGSDQIPRTLTQNDEESEGSKGGGGQKTPLPTPTRSLSPPGKGQIATTITKNGTQIPCWPRLTKLMPNFATPSRSWKILATDCLASGCDLADIAFRLEEYLKADKNVKGAELFPLAATFVVACPQILKNFLRDDEELLETYKAYRQEHPSQATSKFRPSKEKTWHPDPVAFINEVAPRADNETPITLIIEDPDADDNREITVTIELAIRYLLVVAAQNLKDPDGPPRFLMVKASDYNEQYRKFCANESSEKRSLEKFKILNKDRLKKIGQKNITRLFTTSEVEEPGDKWPLIYFVVSYKEGKRPPRLAAACRTAWNNTYKKKGDREVNKERKAKGQAQINPTKASESESEDSN